MMDNSHRIAKKLLLEKEISIRDITGNFLLTGVGFNAIPNNEEFREFNECNTITIILDDIPFTFVEDPQDGYRSTLDKVFVGGDVQTKFEPIEVCFEYRETSEYHSESDLIYGFDKNIEGCKNQDACLIIGTDNTDDYYPFYVATWNPENLYVNHISS